MQASVFISETFTVKKSFNYSPSGFSVLQKLKQPGRLVNDFRIHGAKCSSEAAGMLKINCGTEIWHGLSPVS